MHAFAEHMVSLLGRTGWLSGADAVPYSRDWLDRFGEAPIGVARPSSTRQVSAVVKACAQAGVIVVPQGGNTGLCGGSVADRPGAVILSLSRMNAIGALSATNETIVVEAGLVLARLHAELAEHGLAFPMHLGSKGTAQIGGLISTNAGGSHALRHGTMQDLVLGLEVVLPDGEIWDGLRMVRKDNAGYALRKLFCGAEGTLGIVTRAVLRVLPADRGRATALLVCPDHLSAIAFGRDIRAEAGEFLSGLEFFSDFGLSLLLRHLPEIAFPLPARGEVYLLAELSTRSGHVPLDAILMELVERGLEKGTVIDGAVAASQAQRDHFWRLREEQPEAQRREGPQLKYDIAVPLDRIAEFIARAAPICEALSPGARINPFGHLGDGNIHFNLSAPAGEAAFAGSPERLGEALAALATGMTGTFAAEHGLGRAKVALADASRDAVERMLMVRLKQALDPGGTMNPGVIVKAP